MVGITRGKVIKFFGALKHLKSFKNIKDFSILFFFEFFSF